MFTDIHTGWGLPCRTCMDSDKFVLNKPYMVTIHIWSIHVLQQHSFIHHIMYVQCSV